MDIFYNFVYSYLKKIKLLGDSQNVYTKTVHRFTVTCFFDSHTTGLVHDRSTKNSWAKHQNKLHQANETRNRICA